MARALVNVPKTARRGEVIEVKVLLAHPMETGFRPGPDGAVLPRNIIERLVCTYGGEEVFRAVLSPAVAANPFLSFTTVATETGTLALTWTGDGGFSQTETATITVV